MKRVKSVFLRLLYPGGAWIFALMLQTGVLWVFCFISGRDDTPVAYTVYVLSAYVLTVALAAVIPRMNKNVKALLHRNAYGSRYVSDAAFRAKISLYQGLFMNLLFVVFKSAMSWIYSSFWFGAVAVYYVVLCVMRLLLLRDERKILLLEDPDERFRQGVRAYRFCGYLMLILNTAMSGVIIQMVWHDKGYQYPWQLVYASAANTFYCLIIAIINLFRFRKLDNPVLSASKMLSFVAALMSILALQTAMLAEFGNDVDNFRQFMNSATGGGVSIIVFGMAVFMVVRANRVLKAQKASENARVFS